MDMFDQLVLCDTVFSRQPSHCSACVSLGLGNLENDICDFEHVGHLMRCQTVLQS